MNFKLFHETFEVSKFSACWPYYIVVAESKFPVFFFATWRKLPNKVGSKLQAHGIIWNFGHTWLDAGWLLLWSEFSCKFKAGFSLQSARFLGNDGDNVVLRQNIVFFFSLSKKAWKNAKYQKNFSSVNSIINVGLQKKMQLLFFLHNYIHIYSKLYYNVNIIKKLCILLGIF